MLRFIGFLLAFAVPMIKSEVLRAAIVVPVGVNAGDKFRIVFVSTSIAQASSSNILDYDAYIMARAVAGGLDTYNGQSVDWQVLGSTAAVNAIDRVPLTSSAIYRVDGMRVAVDGQDLWDGILSIPIVINEFGTSSNTEVWTGTTHLGLAGTNPLGAANGITSIGSSSESGIAWTIIDSDSSDQLHSMYGISSELTAVAIPEPNAFALAASLASCLVVRARRRGG